jgi:hypothetical protein
MNTKETKRENFDVTPEQDALISALQELMQTTRK